MKLKTSITLSEDLMQAVEGLLQGLEGEFHNRSDVIEQALRDFLKRRGQQFREAADLALLNKKAEALNEETEDVLSYQADL